MGSPSFLASPRRRNRRGPNTVGLLDTEMRLLASVWIRPSQDYFREDSLEMVSHFSGVKMETIVERNVPDERLAPTE